jgi:hypothetical protein
VTSFNFLCFIAIIASIHFIKIFKSFYSSYLDPKIGTNTGLTSFNNSASSIFYLSSKEVIINCALAAT